MRTFFSRLRKPWALGNTSRHSRAHSGVLGRAAELTGVPFRTQALAPHLSGRAHVPWLCPESLQAHSALAPRRPDSQGTLEHSCRIASYQEAASAPQAMQYSPQDAHGLLLKGL